MAEIKEVTVSRSVRINTGNYEGTEHFVSMRAELDELDTPEDAAAELAAKVERAVVAQLHRSYKVRGKEMSVEKVARHHGLSYVPIKGK